MKHHKAAVLGSIPRDRIITPTKEVIERYGCVSHTTRALSKFLEKKGIIFQKKNQQIQTI